MYDKCNCPTGSLYCEKYKMPVTFRQHQFLRGDSGIARDREEVYVAGLLNDVGPREEKVGFVEQAVTYARALVKHVANLGRNVSEEVLEERLQICRDCDSRVVEEEVERCKECTCPILSKAPWASEDCPRKKWPPLPMVEAGAGGCGACKKASDGL